MDENIFVLMHIFILVADYGREGPMDENIFSLKNIFVLMHNFWAGTVVFIYGSIVGLIFYVD